MRNSRRGILTVTAGMLLGFLLFGCGGPQTPTAKPSKQEVQADADRFFEELREEEQQRSQGDEPAE